MEFLGKKYSAGGEALALEYNPEKFSVATAFVAALGIHVVFSMRQDRPALLQLKQTYVHSSFCDS